VGGVARTITADVELAGFDNGRLAISTKRIAIAKKKMNCIIKFN
jgi:hypothetical protein